MRWRSWLDALVLEFRSALRRLAKNPAFAVVACSSLALGIGANTAAFGVLYAVLLRPLPVRDPQTLALVSTKYAGPGTQHSMPYPAYTYPARPPTRSRGSKGSGGTPGDYSRN